MSDGYEDDLTAAYMAGYYDAKKVNREITKDKIMQGIKEADPDLEDICPWSFKKGVQFALSQTEGEDG